MTYTDKQIEQVLSLLDGISVKSIADCRALALAAQILTTPAQEPVPKIPAVNVPENSEF